MRYVGDGFAVDSTAFAVERDGQAVDLEPQAMDLLLYMLARPGELLTKAELLDNVWGDQFVGDAALATRIKQVRAALGDDGRAQRIIQTVHGRGYKFVAELEGVAGAAPVDDADPRHNIPVLRTELIGRDELVAEVIEAASTDRLVTLVGLGGAGKTTIAQAAGRELAERFGDGAWFIDLIPVRDGPGLVRAVAEGLGFRAGPDTAQADVVRWLSQRHVCLVLDNCEHLVDDAAAFCSAVLDGSPSTTVVATSREPLRVVGERRLSVGPLPVVETQGGALELLEAVARRAGASLGEADRPSALELCARVDGLPLAIELVGARLATFSLTELVDRLDQLGVGGGGDRRPDRHASLDVVLAETLAALDDATLQLLTLLSRLVGGFDVDEVESMATHGEVDRPLDRLGELVDRSLVVVRDAAPQRFGVLEMVRQHVGARDPKPDRTSTIHAAWCRALVGDSVAQHFHDLMHADLVSRRYQDLIDARNHLVSLGQVADAADIVAATGLAMHLDDGSRAAEMLRLVGDHAELVDDPRLEARLHCSGVMAAMAAREHQAMFQHGVDAVIAAERADDPALHALSLVMRTWAGVVLDVEGAMRDLDDAVRLAESVGDFDTAMMATGYKSLSLAMALRFDEAVAIADTALARDVGRSSYPRRVVATALISCLMVEDPQRAIELDERVRAGAGLASFWGTTIVRAACQAQLGQMAQLGETVHTLETRLDRAGISPLPDILLVPAALALAREEHARASRYLGAVRASKTPTQSLMVSTAYRALRTHIEPVDADRIQDSTAEIWAEARAWMATHTGSS